MCYLIYEGCRHVYTRSVCADIANCRELIQIQVWFCINCWDQKYFSIKPRNRAAKELLKAQIKGPLNLEFFLQKSQYPLAYMEERFHLEKKTAKRYVAKGNKQSYQELGPHPDMRAPHIQEQRLAIMRGWEGKYIKRMSEKQRIKDKDTGEKLWLIMPPILEAED